MGSHWVSLRTYLGIETDGRRRESPPHRPSGRLQYPPHTPPLGVWSQGGRLILALRWGKMGPANPLLAGVALPARGQLSCPELSHTQAGINPPRGGVGCFRSCQRPKERVVLGPAQDQKRGNQKRNGKHPYHTKPNQPIPFHHMPGQPLPNSAQACQGPKERAM